MERNMVKHIFPRPIILLFVLLFTACEKEKVTSTALSENEEFYQLMNDWYLWHDNIPELAPEAYNSPIELLEAIRYQDLDRWSYVTTVEAFTAYYEQAAYSGYGFGHATDNAGNRRITFVFNESPLKEFGVTRGWIIERIDGVIVTANSDLNELLGETAVFSFIKPDGTSASQTFTAKEMTMNTVLHSEVIDVNETKVAHLVFKSFLGPSEQELSTAFQLFTESGTTELILDLRYNGGGRMDIANQLAGLIVPESLNGEVFAKYEHNENKSDENFSYLLEKQPNSLELERLYVITSGNSASASEALINGLAPFIDVVKVGTQTYGKPVGMYAFYQDDDYYAYVPVTFKITNFDGYGEYYDGLPVNYQVGDDITRPFNDPQEACLYQALHHIEFGSFDNNKRLSAENRYFSRPAYNSIKSIRGAL